MRSESWSATLRFLICLLVTSFAICGISHGADTDGDLLPDDLELFLGTSSSLADSDVDGVNDYDDVLPNDATVQTLAPGTKLTAISHDGYTDEIAIGFEIKFYSSFKQTLRFNSDGSILIGGTIPTVGSFTDQQPKIAPILADLDPTRSTGGIFYSSIGSAGQKKFVLTCLSVPLEGEERQDKVSYALSLYENGIIRIHYYRIDFRVALSGISPGITQLPTAQDLSGLDGETLSGAIYEDFKNANAMDLEGWNMFYVPVPNTSNYQVFAVPPPLRLSGTTETFVADNQPGLLYAGTGSGVQGIATAANNFQMHYGPVAALLARPAAIGGATPVNMTPADGATLNTVTPTLTANGFDDPDNPGATHQASQWQVWPFNGSSDTPAWDSSRDTTNKTSTVVPAGKLFNGADYEWRVRFQSSSGLWSDWSSPTSFDVDISNVSDTTPPVITRLGTPSIIVALGSAYSDAGATALDNLDGDITSTIVTANPVNTAVQGLFIVTYNVTDTAGNAATQVTRDVHVVDLTKPLITRNGISPVTVAVGGVYTDLGATAFDNVDGNITANILTVNPVNTAVLGQYTVTYNVSDAADNDATPATRTVIVADLTKPVITRNGASSVTVAFGDPYSDAGATALDNVDGNVTSNIVTTNPVNTNVVGTYTVTYDVSDTAGNAATSVSRTVIVEKTKTVVLLEVQDPIIEPGDPIQVFGELNTVPPTACGGLTGKTIRVLFEREGDSSEQTTTVTGNCTYSLNFAPPQPGEWNVSAFFDGDGELAPDSTEETTVLVQQVAGYAILVAGRIQSTSGLADHRVTIERVYQSLIDVGFTNDRIVIFDSSSTISGPIYEPLTQAGIQSRITTWASQSMRAAPAPLIIVLVNHGSPNLFHIYNSTTTPANNEITPAELDSWLDTLATNLGTDAAGDAAKRQPIFVLNGSCYSGTFLPALAQAQDELPRRIVMSSADAAEESFKGPVEEIVAGKARRDGELFVSRLFGELGDGRDLRYAFSKTADFMALFTNNRSGNGGRSTRKYLDSAAQHAMIDDNGDGVATHSLHTNPQDGEDGGKASHFKLGFGPVNNVTELTFVGASPAITLTAGGTEKPTVTAELDAPVPGVVWCTVKSPSFAINQNEQTEQKIVDLSHINPAAGKSLKTYTWGPAQFAGIGFETPGRYEISFFARDDNDELAAPMHTYVYRPKSGNNQPSTFNLLQPVDADTIPLSAFFSWGASTDPDGDPVTYTLELEPINWPGGPGGIPPVPTIRIDNLTASYYVFSDPGELTGPHYLVDGITYQWKVTAYDEYGAARESSTTRTVVVDSNTNGIFPGTAIISVIDQVTSEPIAGATILVDGSSGQMQYVGDGHYSVTKPEGTYTFSVTAAPHYVVNVPQTVTLHIGSLTTVEETISLTPDPVKVQIIFTPTGPLTIVEGSTTTFNVKLSKQPANSVAVHIARASGDSNISVQTNSDITFTTSNWNTNKTVTLSAGADADVLEGTAVIRGTSSGLDSVDLTAVEDDTTKRSIVFSATNLTIEEGKTATFQVKLSGIPRPQGAGTAKVTLTLATGLDPSITIQDPANRELVFDRNNWSSYKTVTLAAEKDSDVLEGKARINGSSPLIYGANIDVVEDDTSTRSILFSAANVTIEEGKTATFQVKLNGIPRPQGAGTAKVTLTFITGFDPSITIQDPAKRELVFDRNNWSSYKTVTLAAEKDSDALEGKARINGSSPLIYGANIDAVEDDTSFRYILFSASKMPLPVTEGGTATFQVTLSGPPRPLVGMADVKILKVSDPDADKDISPVPVQPILKFTRADWDKPKNVTLAAEFDRDALEGTAKINGSSPGIIGTNIVAVEADITTRNIIFSPTVVSVQEGGATTQFGVRLNGPPPNNGTIKVAIYRQSSSNSDIQIQSGASLSFNGSNWNSNLPVKLSALADTNTINGSAVFHGWAPEVFAFGVNLTANEIDKGLGKINVLEPAGKFLWQYPVAAPIKWTSDGSVGPNVKIELWQNGTLRKSLFSSTPNDQSEMWALPAALASGTDYRIRITSIRYPEIWGESDPFEIGPARIREEVLPVGSDGLPQVDAQGQMAVRLISDTPIEPNSVWATIDGENIHEIGGTWIDGPLGSNTDGWVAITPSKPLADGIQLEITVGAQTIEGEELTPVTKVFVVKADEADGTAAEATLVEETGISQPIELTDNPVGPIYTFVPSGVFDPPITLEIPLPPTVDPATVQMLYYSESAAHQGWFRAEDVEGWIVPESIQITKCDSGACLVFEVTHSGVLQLYLRE
jgi:hypothetical protein